MRELIENNGIILKRNVDRNGNLYAVKIVGEHKQVYKGNLCLEGIPSEFHRVSIEGYYENIPAVDNIAVGTFNVDYNIGKIYFSEEEEGKVFNVSYYSLGVEMIKAERVITTYMESENFCKTLAEEIRQAQELKDMLMKEIEAAGQIKIVESTEWAYTVKSEEEQSFLMDATILNPAVDLMTIFYNGDFLHNTLYTREGCRIILKDWKAKEGDIFSCIIYKHVVGTIDINGDGSLIIDGSIGRHKLSLDLQSDLSIIPVLQDLVSSIEDRLKTAEEKIFVLEEDNVKNKEDIETIKTVDLPSINTEIDEIQDKVTALEKHTSEEDIIIGGEVNRTLTVENNEGEMVAIVDKDNSSFAKMEIAELVCENVITKQNSVKLYVNSVTGSDDNDGLSMETAFASIMRAVDSLGKYLVRNCFIYTLPGTYNENLMFEGFSGLGSLYLYLHSDVVINGELYVNSCSTGIRIYGEATQITKPAYLEKDIMMQDGLGERAGTPTTLNHTSSSNAPVRVFTSSYVYLTNMNINGNKDSDYVLAGWEGSGVTIRNSTMNNSKRSAVVSFECSSVYVATCGGNGHTEYSIYSGSGSTICITEKIPYAPKENYGKTGFIHGTAVMDTVVAPPTPPPVNMTKTYEATKFAAYRSVDGWKTQVYQGKYDSKNPDSYNYFGTYVLDVAKIKTELTGKTINSVKVTVKRYKEGQGIGQPSSVDLTFYGTGSTGSGAKPNLFKKYTTQGKVSKNQTVTYTMPNALIADIIAGNVKSVCLHTTNGSNYCRMDNVFNLTVSHK